MAIEIKMPMLGMTMEEGKLVEWTRKEKDRVRKGDVLLTIESDKVTFEVESPGEGILAILVEKGEGIPVGNLLGYLAGSDDEYARLRSGAVAAPLPVEAQRAEAAPAQLSAVTGDMNSPFRATPAAREAARRKGVDLSTVIGTGPQGRITLDDVQAIPEKVSPTPTEVPSSARPPVSAPDVRGGRKELMREEEMSGMRAAISRNMMESLRNTAQMTAFSEWDVTGMLRLRSLINAGEEKNGFRATVPGMMVAVLARVLKEMPVFNASVEGGKVRYWRNVNIGVAVALPDGLVVPVIHDADWKSLADIQRALTDLIDRARQNKLLPGDMSGGTFTLTNLGSYRGEWETVIINPPEVAILGIGKAAKKPVVDGDQVVVREMMPVSFTVDHRLIDGETSGGFRKRMKELVENPSLLGFQPTP